MPLFKYHRFLLLASVEALTHIVHLLSPCVNYAAQLGQTVTVTVCQLWDSCTTFYWLRGAKSSVVSRVVS